jgi:hypothetical protein
MEDHEMKASRGMKLDWSDMLAWTARHSCNSIRGRTACPLNKRAWGRAGLSAARTKLALCKVRSPAAPLADAPAGRREWQILRVCAVRDGMRLHGPAGVRRA